MKRDLINRCFKIVITVVIALLLFSAYRSEANSGDSIVKPPEKSVTKTSAEVKPVVAETQFPSDLPLKPDQAVIQYLIEHDYFNPLPDNLFHPEFLILRAELVALLYRASRTSRPFVSEFAYFRDVPVDYWAYLPIEGFRIESIIRGFTEDGYFKPNEPVKRLAAAVILSRTLDESWLKLSQKEVEDTLAQYNISAEEVPVSARYDLARSIYAGFLLPVPTKVPSATDFSLELDSYLTRMDAARMVYRRALIEDEEHMPTVRQLPWIPPGVRITISPTSAISQAQLFVGQTIYFTVVESVELPQVNLMIFRGTRIHGHVTELAADRLQAGIALDKASLPSGESYNMASQLLIRFKSDKEEHRFIVPGENFQIKTLPRQ